MKRLLLPFLLAGSLLAQAPQVPVTGNLGAGGTFPLINSPQVIFASDADHTMTFPEMTGSSGFLLVTSGATLTATRKLIAPLVKGFTWTIKNATTGGQSIQVIGTTGSGVTIPNGATISVSCDGTNYNASSIVGTLNSQAVTLTSGGSTPHCHAGFTCTSLGGVVDWSYNSNFLSITLTWATPVSNIFCRASAWGGAAISSSVYDFTPVSGGTSWSIEFPNATSGNSAVMEYTCLLQ